MLVLSRHRHQKILLPSIDAVIHVLQVKGNTVQIGIEAPREVPIIRAELHERNQVPAVAKKPVVDNLGTRASILVIDDEMSVRESAANSLQQSGYRCQTADGYLSGLETLIDDGDINVVVLDHGLPGDNLAEFVHTVRQVQPETTLIGSSGRDCQAVFVHAGVFSFVQKPWFPRDIQRILSRIDRCRNCGTRLPLRPASLGEADGTWKCVGCEQEYRGVFDRASAPDTLSNVRHAHLGVSAL